MPSGNRDSGVLSKALFEMLFDTRKAFVFGDRFGKAWPAIMLFLGRLPIFGILFTKLKSWLLLTHKISILRDRIAGG